ncbi:MAG: GNAT family N-acetyltransferase [Nanoarchaeota archaeon]|nr:GNAT family N-acetyltransferase [Nanoarchaeota archaeon]
MEVVRKTLDQLNIIENIEKQVSEFKTPYSKKKYLTRLKNRKYSIFFAIENKKEIGYAVSYGKADKFYIWTIAVLEEYREKGVAKELLEKSMEAGKELGYNKVYLKTRNTFQNMIFLALKFGFKIVNLTKKENEDENVIWMEKTI